MTPSSDPDRPKPELRTPHSNDGVVVGPTSAVEEQLRVHAQAIRDAASPMILASLDGRITDCNPAFLELWGYDSKEQIVGRPNTDFADDPETVAEIMEALRTMGRWIGEVRPRKNDGTPFAAQLSASTAYDSDGRPFCLMASFVDITRLRDREARFRAVFDTAADAILMVDAEGLVETANPGAERVFGREQDGLIGRPVTAFLDGIEWDELVSVGADERLRDLEGRRADGATFPLDLTISRVHDGLFSVIARDLSERTELQARITQAERLAAIGELASSVAHEVNNPVSTMINCAQLLKDGDEDPALLDDIIEEGLRIAGIVRNLLSFAHEDECGPDAVRIADVVERTMALTRKRLQGAGVGLSVELGRDLPAVRAHAQQLQQVLLNLVLNARDALDERRDKPKEIQIRCELATEDPGLVQLVVRDNGPGIPTELQRKVFRSFFTTKAARGGTGLGLAISRRIVEEHGGTLELSSTPNEFAEFRVRLPAIQTLPDLTE